MPHTITLEAFHKHCFFTDRFQVLAANYYWGASKAWKRRQGERKGFSKDKSYVFSSNKNCTLLIECFLWARHWMRFYLHYPTHSSQLWDSWSSSPFDRWGHRGSQSLCNSYFLPPHSLAHPLNCRLYTQMLVDVWYESNWKMFLDARQVNWLLGLSLGPWHSFFCIEKRLTVLVTPQAARSMPHYILPIF